MGSKWPILGPHTPICPVRVDLTRFGPRNSRNQFNSIYSVCVCTCVMYSWCNPYKDNLRPYSTYTVVHMLYICAKPIPPISSTIYRRQLPIPLRIPRNDPETRDPGNQPPTSPPKHPVIPYNPLNRYLYEHYTAYALYIPYHTHISWFGGHFDPFPWVQGVYLDTTWCYILPSNHHQPNRCTAIYTYCIHVYNIILTMQLHIKHMQIHAEQLELSCFQAVLDPKGAGFGPLTHD